MTMEIRPYRESDEEAVVALWREVFPDAPAYNDPREDIARKIRVQRDLFLVAEVEGMIVGTAMAGFDGHRGWIYLLAVRASYRRRGIGTALIERVEQGLAAMGCPKLNLMVRTSNEAVVPFYRKLGFEIQDVVTLGRRLVPQPDTRGMPGLQNDVRIKRGAR
jgi:ribosomal protein S18 acetylase RimI-like enzyme